MYDKQKRRIILAAMCIIPAAIIIGLVWIVWGGVSNPAGRKCIGEISTPHGFERVSVEEGSFGDYLRHVPLQRRGAHMRYYNGKIAYGQYFGYAVLDMPMISNAEQCADAVMRMRAEYLWSIGQYGRIHFHAVSGRDQKYSSGADRTSFENYLTKVFDCSNTTSLRREMKPKDIQHVAPGDVFVYESPGQGLYGHAVLVADVAYNVKTGQTALMLVQSSTPALTMHIIRDIFHPIRSPWVILDETCDCVVVSGIHFGKDDLREWQ